MLSVTKNLFKYLSPSKINSSREIKDWLAQFPEIQRSTAKLLLSRLQFVSRDVYSAWLQRVVAELPSGKIYALYAVRKLDGVSRLWNERREIVTRPGDSQGSEDLVYSLVANLARANPNTLLDHPSLDELRINKVHDYLLIDDSIGSGERVSGFINAMLNHPTFLSWWSSGFIKIHVVSFARPREAEATIIAEIKGSDHGKRKFRKSDKVEFTSEIVYERIWYEARWGTEYKSIIDLCEKRTEISRWECFGYGDVMANLVFYHSVPDNIPGMLWSTETQNGWQSLLPNRAVPNWLLTLLDQPPIDKLESSSSIPDELIRLLMLVKRGVRSTRSIAIQLCVDHKYALGLIENAQNNGLLTAAIRLTALGLDRLKQLNRNNIFPSWDFSLYIPNSWCAGNASKVIIQPPIQRKLASKSLADSAEVSAFADGDVG